MTEEVKTPDPPRDDKGKFVVKEKIVEKIVNKEVMDETSKAILEGLDAELKTKLGEDIYNDYKDYDLPIRVKNLQNIMKSVDKFEREKKGSIDKTGEVKTAGDVPPPEPPKEKKPEFKTLAELNNSKEFLRDMRQHSSYLEASKRIRKGN